MSCTNCGTEKVVANGLCRPCYMRLKRTGSTEYKRKGKPIQLCSVESCDRFIVAKGLCGAHYQMMMRKGEVVSSFGYGDRVKHPLYFSWKYQYRIKEGRESIWNDFWKFVEDVGDKPSEKHVLRRLDINSPWGPENFYWYETKTSSLSAKDYQKRFRESNPERAKGYELNKSFGISISDYMDMYEKQDHKCLVCGKEGVAFSQSSDSRKTLVVDHCHDSGKVRGLLCGTCNLGLGYFEDNTDTLEKAISYLNEFKIHKAENPINQETFEFKFSTEKVEPCKNVLTDEELLLVDKSRKDYERPNNKIKYERLYYPVENPKQCKNCGKEMGGDRYSNATACSRKCQTDYQNKKNKEQRREAHLAAGHEVGVCQTCGTFFEGKPVSTKYCSERCRIAARNQGILHGTCLCCGAAFEAERKTRKFCSVSCGGKFRDQQKSARESSVALSYAEPV